MRVAKSVVVFCCLFSSVCLAQLYRGSLSGTVTDPNGAVIPGVRVIAKQDQTGVQSETMTSGAGVYAFPSLALGPYTITVELTGFKKLVRSGITIFAARRQVLDVRLEIGDVVQTVEVTAAAPPLASATGELGTNFLPQLMRNAPLFTGGIRNPEAFVAYMPGVNNGAGDSSINGSSRRSKEVLLDGAGFTIPESGGVVFNFPAAEMFGEFRLLTNNFSAEYGRTGGGIEIFTTKSGANDLHGALYQNIRRDIFDANAWVNNAAGRRRPKTRLNEQGLAAGGPIWLPKLYDGRNKSFFYFTWTRRRQAAGISPVLSTVATPLMKQGDFSQIPLPIFDPATTTGSGATATRQPFPGNRIPQQRISAISAKILPLIPNPTGAGIVNNYSHVNTSDFKQDTWSLKFDHTIVENNRVSVFWSSEGQTSVDQLFLPAPLSHGLESAQKPQNLRVNHDLILRPNLLLHSTFGFSRTQQFFDNPEQKGWSTKLGLRGVAQTVGSGFPVVSFTGPDNFTAFAATNGPKTSGTQFNWTWHFNQGLSWINGRHEWKFGWDFRRLRTFADPLDLALVQGRFTFDRFQTADPARRATTGNAFASFLLGETHSGEVRVSANDPKERTLYGYQAFYVQDNIKVTPKLILNLGLRYDLPLARSNTLGEFTSFDPRLANPRADNRPGALAYVGFGPGRIGRKRFADLDFTEFGPRFGFAYQINSKTVLRGGYGIYYAAANHTTGGFCLGCAFGFDAVPQRTSADGYSPALQWDGGFVPPPGFIAPPFIDPSFANDGSPWYLDPRSGTQSRHQNWNVNLQRELPGNIILDIAYAAQRGRNMNATIQLNQVDPKFLSLGALLGRNINDREVVAGGFTKPFSSFNGSLAQALRPYPQFLDLPSHYSALGRNWYDSLQTKVERRFGSALFLVGYTWSKTLSLGARTQTAFNEEPQNSYNFAAEKTYQVYDWPHVLNIITSFDLPFGRGKKWLHSTHPVLTRIVGGWTLSGLQQYRSGYLIPLSAPNTLGSGVLFTSFKRAHLTGQKIRTSLARTDLDPNNPNARWLNRDAFAAPGQFEFGTAARYHGDLRQPPVFLENLGIVKRTLVTERVDFEYRLDMFNLFNRTNFGGINAVLTSPAFGRPSGPQQGARIITMGFRLNW